MSERDASNLAFACFVLSLVSQASSQVPVSQLAVQNPPLIAGLLQVMLQRQVKWAQLWLQQAVKPSELERWVSIVMGRLIRSCKHLRSNNPPYQPLHDAHSGSKALASGGTPMMGAYGSVRAQEKSPRPTWTSQSIEEYLHLSCLL